MLQHGTRYFLFQTNPFVIFNFKNVFFPRNVYQLAIACANPEKLFLLSLYLSSKWILTKTRDLHSWQFFTYKIEKVALIFNIFIFFDFENVYLYNALSTLHKQVVKKYSLDILICTVISHVTRNPLSVNKNCHASEYGWHEWLLLLNIGPLA